MTLTRSVAKLIIGITMIIAAITVRADAAQTYKDGLEACIAWCQGVCEGYCQAWGLECGPHVADFDGYICGCNGECM